jgi:hypothetical protein
MQPFWQVAYRAEIERQICSAMAESAMLPQRSFLGTLKIDEGTASSREHGQ